MTLRHLKIFVCVYQNKSITKAGEMLHIAQPSISLAIKELESYYGIVFFDRIAKKIYPTECGDKLYQYAIHIVSLFEEMETDIKKWNDNNTLTVGSSITVGNFLIPNVVTKYKTRYPDARVHVMIKNTETIVQYILDNQIDFGIIEGDAHEKQIIQLPILDDRLCLIVPKNHPLTRKSNVYLSDLVSYDLLLREPGSAGRDIIDSVFAANSISITPLWESVSTQALIRGVMNNIGISILPYLLVKEHLDKNEIIEIPLKDFNFKRHFSIIYHKNKYLSAAALSFMDLCREIE